MKGDFMLLLFLMNKRAYLRLYTNTSQQPLNYSQILQQQNI